MRTEESKAQSRIVPGSREAQSGIEASASELHPRRFDVRFEVKLDEKDYVPAENFNETLKKGLENAKGN